MNNEKRSDHLKGLKVLKEELPPHRTIRTHAPFIRHDMADFDSIQRLKHFVEAINLGMLPDGEVMIYIADAIKEYLEENKKSLDEAFALRSIKGQGNAAKCYRKVLKLRDQAISIFLFRLSSENEEDAAIKTLEMAREDSESYSALLKRKQRLTKNKTFKHKNNK